MTSGDLESVAVPARRCCFLALVCWSWLAGCTAPGKPLRECPLSVDEQQQAVLEIVPKGTFRDEAERRLNEAGIEFTTSGNASIFYLSLWDRPNGERWHINVALFFDSSGRLYQTRKADSPMALLSGNEPGDRQRPATGASGTGNPPGRIAPAAVDDDEGPERVAFPGLDRQVPSGAR